MSQKSLSFYKEISFYLLNYYNIYDLDKLSKFIMISGDNDLNELFRIHDLCDIILSSIEKKIFKSEVSIDYNFSNNNELINDLTNYIMSSYMCEELIYNDIILTIKKFIVPSIKEYVNNHKEENKMKLFNKLPLEINDFETIIPYLGLCNLFFENLGFLLGSYNMTSGVFTPSNEIKQIYKLSK